MKEHELPRICVICGIKNSGKTTLIRSLIGEFKNRGLRCAVIKHDGHDFTCDVPGTDSHLFYEAGAYGTAVFSRHRIFVHREEIQPPGVDRDMNRADETRWEQEKTEELMGLFPDADIILVEGLKNTSLPKVEVVRADVSSGTVSNPEGRFLIVTELLPENYEEKVLRPDEVGKIADEVLRSYL
jgi:molybdopterin-guanine dinucleotide biosynthesis protein B